MYLYAKEKAIPVNKRPSILHNLCRRCSKRRILGCCELENTFKIYICSTCINWRLL